ncbi:hypothetical protein [Arthrobacter sp. UYEF3]|uniref:hypothetical protein n=1 Tax=Arthrobacter sp. UYEF3 TaxID=1756365 RepID=UPI00339873BE
MCSEHHQLIHKEHPTVRVRSSVPWFIPPPFIDPQQYFRPRIVADIRHEEKI